MRISRAQARKFGLTVGKSKPRVKLGKPAVTFEEQCARQGIQEPVPEFRFAPARKWKFDYCWPEIHLALEVEGGIYGTGKPCPVCRRRAPGGHSSVSGIKRDIEKYREATIAGYRVLRCLPSEINDGSIFPILKRAMEAKP